MDNPLQIRVFCAPEQAEAHLAILGSLPASFQTVPEGQPDIALVGPDAASISTGLASAARMLVLVDPWMIDDIEELTRAAVPVVPVGRLFPLMAGLDADMVGQQALVRCSIASRQSLAASVYEQLSALQVLLGPLAGVKMLSQIGSAYSGTARAGKGVELVWSGQAGAIHDSLELDVMGIAQRLEILATPDDTARPATVHFANADGLTQSRGVYESGLRLFWRSVAADLAGGPKTTRLSDFLDLLMQVRQLTHIA